MAEFKLKAADVTGSLTPSISLFAGDITQKGYEKKRLKLIREYIPHAGGNLAASDLPTHMFF